MYRRYLKKSPLIAFGMGIFGNFWCYDKDENKLHVKIELVTMKIIKGCGQNFTEMNQQ
jgi:hypothetical protein